MIRTIFLFLVFFFFVGTQVHAQLIPPARPDGFAYPPGRRVEPDTILIEAFYDPVCPYSRDSWPPLKQALKHYGSRVSLLLHLLPLPYHDNAHIASRALHIVNTHNASATFGLLEGFFKHQEMFYGAKTQLLTRPEVVGRIVNLGTATLGNSYHHLLKSGFNDTNSERATRVSFKYSASRGVYGTPTFYVNGFVLPDDPSSFGGWKKIIDSLVQPHKVER
ncbi:Thioredoxin-like_fold domain-containing protein [Hirschfeldia incana]|nr:Thioredoxin-like_fold domain-containing protein [Hirschfeldia incana]